MFERIIAPESGIMNEQTALLYALNYSIILGVIRSFIHAANFVHETD